MPNRIIRDWTDSERVNALTAQAEVLFVRLIMKADDYGRFYGNPQLLKSYLYPLKDIRIADISRWITECVNAGLIANYEVAGKRYIEILNFNQRLRLNHGSKFPSSDGQMTVKCQTNDGHLTDMRPPEARSEKREALKKTVANATAKESVSFDLFDLPDNLNFPEFREKWDEWLKYRRATKKTVSKFAAKKQIATLAQYDVQTAISMIDESIKNDWQGIFPLKQNGGGNAPVTPEMRKVKGI